MASAELSRRVEKVVGYPPLTQPVMMCDCPEPFVDDELCLRCGHTLREPLAA